MNKVFRACVLLTCLSVVSPSFADAYRPTDREVKVAILGLMVAAGSTMGARTLEPPVEFSESRFVVDETYGDVSLVMDNADIGALREVVLNSPAPPPRQIGLLELLAMQLNPFSLDYHAYANFIRPQKLGPNEMIADGTIRAVRFTDSYPFRYEGSAVVHVSGIRFAQPLTMEFTFTVPLEGPQSLTIITETLLVNGYDSVHVARNLFTPSS